jgi:hypothetical protein
MSKRKFSIVSGESSTCTDWSLCLCCQRETQEKLICPNNSKQKDKCAGYRTLVNDLDMWFLFLMVLSVFLLFHGSILHTETKVTQIPYHLANEF